MDSTTDIQRWLDRTGPAFIRKAGVHPGQTVLDFGCRSGSYTIPAAKVVGPTGSVFAVDKDCETLRTFRRTIRRQETSNIRCLCIVEGEDIPVPARSVDVVLLYDVLHGGYFPEHDQRLKLVRKLRRVLKPKGLLSLYPTHLKKYGLTFDTILSEVRQAGFHLRGEARRKLLHDDQFTRGRVFSFTKA